MFIGCIILIFIEVYYLLKSCVIFIEIMCYLLKSCVIFIEIMCCVLKSCAINYNHVEIFRL